MCMTIDSDELERDGESENYLVCESTRPLAILHNATNIQRADQYCMLFSIPDVQWYLKDITKLYSFIIFCHTFTHLEI